jgi:Mrp family chromosome partitioning ATPase
MSALYELSQNMYDIHIKGLGERLIYGENGTPFKVVLVTSARHGHGVSTVSLNLAKYLSKEGACNVSVLRLPSISSPDSRHDQSKQENGVLLTGPEAKYINITDVIIPEDGNLPAASSAKINSLKNDYSFIIMDTPPIMTAPEMLFLVPLSDIVMVVVRSNSIKWQPLKDYVDFLQTARPRNICVVLNRKKYYIPQSIYSKL